MQATYLVLALLAVGAGCVGCYALLLHRLRQIAAERDLKIADQFAALDAAIQALETRLAERRNSASRELADSTSVVSRNGEAEAQEEAISGELKAVIAAAATTVLGKNAAVKSVRSVPTPWSQQGRVLVQGSHNLRARR